MRSLLSAALVFFLALQAKAGPQHCTFRVHVAANANDSAAFAQPVRSLSGRDVFIDKTAWISERDVKAFYPYRAADGSYGALLELDDHGRAILDTLSVERRGSPLFVFINGRPLTELYLASGLTEADIKLMNKDWKLLGRKKKK
ncbi:MAG: hypothetical protein ABI217_03735 [Chthoniobacterales bacterium]